MSVSEFVGAPRHAAVVSPLPRILEIAIQLEALEGCCLSAEELLGLAEHEVRALLEAIPVAEEQRLAWTDSVADAMDPDELTVRAGEAAAWGDLTRKLREALRLAVL